MPHIVHQRLTHAFATLGKNTSDIAGKMNLESGELETALEQESLVSFSLLTDICTASGVCRDYALLEHGPMTPKVKSPLQTDPASKPNTESASDKSPFESFKDRLAAVMDILPLTDAEIGEAMNLTRQSVSRWRQNGLISKGNLQTLCAIEGLDDKWVVDGIIDSEEAQATHDRVYGTKLSQIDNEIARLQAQRALIVEGN